MNRKIIAQKRVQALSKYLKNIEEFIKIRMNYDNTTLVLIIT